MSLINSLRMNVVQRCVLNSFDEFPMKREFMSILTACRRGRGLRLYGTFEDCKNHDILEVIADMRYGREWNGEPGELLSQGDQCSS